MAEADKSSVDVTRFAGLETIRLEIVVHVGTATLPLERMRALRPGEVIPLDRRIGESFDLRSGEVVLARVEPVGHEEGIAVKIVDVPRGEERRARS